ncbi:MAG: MBL fold metallo-hydrolase [Proteobacteria bacterium]|nr:MBL fold metallo-hydrolase [Pseudomonadota bacterium]
MTEPNQPLRAAIIPVTPLQQNCTLLWCANTMRGAFVDPGGDLPVLKSAMEKYGVTVEKVLITHGHFDHAAGAAQLAEDLGVPIEGPHPDDNWLIEKLGEDGVKYGVPGRSFVPDRWLDQADEVTVGEVAFAVHHTPGHTPGHVVFHNADSKLAIVGDVLFQGSIGRTDFPRGDHQQLINSIVTRLWPMGDDTVFLPGHGQPSTFAQERASNPFVADSVLA